MATLIATQRLFSNTESPIDCDAGQTPHQAMRIVFVRENEGKTMLIDDVSNEMDASLANVIIQFVNDQG